MNLRDIHLFANLGEDALKKIAPAVALRTYPKGHTLHNEGDRCYAFFAVRAGSVKVYKLSADGREYVFMTAGPGQTFAEVPVFDGGVYPAFAETLEDTELYEIQADTFRAILRSEPDVALALLADMAKRLRVFTEQLEALTFRDVTARLAAYLLDAARTIGVERPDGTHVDLTVSQHELAATIGTVREIVSRSLRKLEQAGLITHKRKHIVIRDEAGLAALC